MNTLIMHDNQYGTVIPSHTRLLSVSVCRILPKRSLCIFTHNRMFTTMSVLSPYCCSKRLGVHRTAVLNVWAFTVLLFYSYPNYAQTGIPMDLPIYPPNTIPQHLYIDSNNTIYWLNKASICLSQDRGALRTVGSTLPCPGCHD